MSRPLYLLGVLFGRGRRPFWTLGRVAYEAHRVAGADDDFEWADEPLDGRERWELAARAAVAASFSRTAHALFVACWLRARVFWYEHGLRKRSKKVPLPKLPDGLRWAAIDGDGRVRWQQGPPPELPATAPAVPREG